MIRKPGFVPLCCNKIEVSCNKCQQIFEVYLQICDIIGCYYKNQQFHVGSN